MAIISIEGKVHKFNVLSEAMEFMLGIDKIAIQKLSNHGQHNLIQRHQGHQNEEGNGKDPRKLEFDCQIITSKKTRKGLFVQPGINVCGVCRNKKCELYGQIVYCHLQNEEPWNIPRMIEFSHCPECKSNIGNNIKNIAYYNCQWKVIGKIKGEKKSFKLTEQTNPRQCKQYLMKNEEPTVQFEYLSIQGKPL